MFYNKNLLVPYSETEEQASIFNLEDIMKKPRKNTINKTKNTKNPIKRKKKDNGLKNYQPAPKKQAKSDPRFDFTTKDKKPNVLKQLLKYTHVNVLDSNYHASETGGSLLRKTEVTFPLPPHGTLLPGNQTRFYIEGIFEKKGRDEDNWTACTNAEASEVIVSPNWFDRLIEEIKLTSANGSTLDLNSVPQYISPHINEMLYAHMHPELKQYLCKEDCHPGNAVTLTRSKWDFNGEDWIKYAPSIFNGDKFRFSYIPLNTWPFYQNGSFVLDAEQPPKAIDLSGFVQGQVKIRFNTNFVEGDNIFKKKEGNLTEYRVRITDIKLALELAEENIDVFPKTGLLNYIGTSKKAYFNDVQDNLSIMRFDNITLPNSLLFFFLPKTVLSGALTYQDEEENAGFRKHPLEHIQVKFNMLDLYSTSTDRDAYLKLFDATNLENHLNYPISGIPVNKNTLTLKQLLEDGTHYAFPHTYIRLSPGYDQMLMPKTGKIDQLQEPGTMEIKMTFTKGAQYNKDLTVLVYAFYDDDRVNVIADVKEKTFLNPYMNLPK